MRDAYDQEPPTIAEQARLEQILEDVCEGLAVRPGRVAITRHPYVEARATGVAGRVELLVSLFTLRAASADALRWMVAHECAHVTHKDSSLVRFTLAGITIFGGWIILLGTSLLLAMGHLWAQVTVVVVGVVLALIVGATVLGLTPDRLRRSRRAAARAQVRELRCDLVATRRYGSAAAAEAIQLVAESDERPEHRYDERYSTHPSAVLRMAVIRADEGRGEPDDVARSLHLSLSSPAPGRPVPTSGESEQIAAR